MLAEDQLETVEAEGALDELSKRINNKKEVLSAIGAAQRFDEALQLALAKDKNNDNDKKVNTENKISQNELLKNIKKDMER